PRRRFAARPTPWSSAPPSRTSPPARGRASSAPSRRSGGRDRRCSSWSGPAPPRSPAPPCATSPGSAPPSESHAALTGRAGLAGLDGLTHHPALVKSAMAPLCGASPPIVPLAERDHTAGGDAEGAVAVLAGDVERQRPPRDRLPAAAVGALHRADAAG